MSEISIPRSEFAALRRFVPKNKAAAPCELCSIGLAAEHAHLVEPANRQILCACEACALLFSSQAGTKYRRVPRDARFLANFEITDAQWDGLLIPISMAFFFYSSPLEKMIALYPSPAGPTESLLALDSWSEIVTANPILKNMEADVEALLVNRVGRVHEYYLAPIDECYKLVGLIRTHWHGLSGGTEVWNEINGFFKTLKERARVSVT
jgi:hypothetical protein